MAHTVFHHLFVALTSLVKGLILLPIWLGVVGIGYLFWTQPSPFNLLAGFPLMLLGATLSLAVLYETIVALISWRWGREHCPLCRSPQDVEKILSPQDGFK